MILLLLALLQDREPWTTSRLTGTPEPPPPCRTERIWPDLTFAKPVHLVPAPGGGYVAVEERGKLWSVSPGGTRALFADLPAEIRTAPKEQGWKGVQACYAVAFDPDFDENRFCYVMYVLRGGDKERGSRVSRFRVTETTPPRLDAAAETIVIEWRSGGHNGCDLQFGNDGMLYVSTGDAERPSPPDSLDTGQDVTDLLSSILRLDVRTLPYSIPPDNPFAGRKGVRPEVWAYGFRNPWRMSFDRETGRLWVGDVGWERWELIMCAQRGANYGWSVVEGPTPVRPDAARGPTPIVPVAHAIPHPEGASITGGFVYRGRRLEGLRGHYVYGDWETRRIWANPVDGTRLGERRVIARTPARVVAFAEEPDGELLVVDHEGGGIFRIVPNDDAAANAAFPRKLSETGLFASVPDQTPAPGVLPYDANAERWADGATGRRWIAIPGRGSIELVDKNAQWPNESVWPKDSVVAKTLSLDDRNVETQILHFDGLIWNAYSYAWNEAQTDAALVGAEGADLGTWRIPPRAACLTCHTPWQGYALTIHPEQLQRGGQIARLQRAGILPKNVAKRRPLVDPYDASRPLDARARSWLAANCAHCHRFGGGGSAVIDLRFGPPLEKTKTVDVPPMLGDFGLEDARLIAPGDPARSVLLFRVAKLGSGHMPHLGSTEVDARGLRLLADWIRGLGTPAKREGDLSGPTPALELLLSLDARPEKERRDVVARALARPPGPVRDLFERFEPRERRRRRLGLVFPPDAVLSLEGDPERGARLFRSPGLRCDACHRVGTGPETPGPDLADVGKRLKRPEILEAILDPSRKVDEKFRGLRVQTVRDEVVSGILVSRDDEALVIRDVGGTKRLPLADVRREAPMTRSLMPDNLLRNLTAQEAADLLDYLTSLR